MSVTIWTIGHSSRSFDEFAGLLHRHDLQRLVDVRAHPGSRKHPQFGTDQFATLLADTGIEYVHEPGLGGRRRLDPEAPPEVAGGWRNASFRAYAQYTRTPAFADALARLRAHAREARTVICCSEAVPWRCHRWLVSEVLTAAGDEVRHVVGAGAARVHAMSEMARIEDGRVSWPDDSLQHEAASAR